MTAEPRHVVTSLRAVDGYLCRLAEDRANPAITDAAKASIDARIADLLSQRAQLAKPRTAPYRPPELFRPPDPLRAALEAIAGWCRGVAEKAEAQGNDALAATAPRIAEEIERALAGEPLAYAREDQAREAELAEIVGELRDRGLRRAR